MALSKQAILNRQAEQGIPHISPRFGDGGWHTTPGCMEFSREWEPLGDHILVELDDEPEAKNSIFRPDVALNQEKMTRTGTVLKVGPGKRIDDEPSQREPMYLMPGDRVIVGQYSDWESWDADWEGRDRNIAVFQQNDVRAICN